MKDVLPQLPIHEINFAWANNFALKCPFYWDTSFFPYLHPVSLPISFRVQKMDTSVHTLFFLIFPHLNPASFPGNYLTWLNVSLFQLLFQREPRNFYLSRTLSAYGHCFHSLPSKFAFSSTWHLCLMAWSSATFSSLWRPQYTLLIQGFHTYFYSCIDGFFLLNTFEAYYEVSKLSTQIWSGALTTHSSCPAVLVSCGCCNKLAQTDGLRQLKFILLQFWRPEVWNWSVGTALLPPEAPGENLFLVSSSFMSPVALLSLWLHLCSPSSHCLPLCVPVFSSLIRILCVAFRPHVYMQGLSPHLKILNWIISAKIAFLK